MPPNTLDYLRTGATPTTRPRHSAAASVLAWMSFVFGGIAVGCLPELMAAGHSMAGFLFAPPIWFIALVSVVTGTLAVILRRRGVVGWLGLLLGIFALLWCTAYMVVPPARKDF
jgi:hypothetical protein